MGWVVFGAIPGNQNQVNRVFNLQQSSPVDMTDFWTTEAMEVSAKPCYCNVEKLSPVKQQEKRVIEDSFRKSKTSKEKITKRLILRQIAQIFDSLGFAAEMKELNNVNVERCLTPPNVIGQPFLCIFSDASEKVFGTCVYSRWPLVDGVFDIRFITAKSRVAPLKLLTIARMELQAAVLASRLGKTIMEKSELKYS